MVLKAVFFLLALTASQVFAVSVIQLRSLDILASRQTVCPICTAVSDALSSCSTSSAPVACACSSTISSGAQACITCAIAANPSQSIICTSQAIIDTHAQLCPGSPALKLPPGIAKPVGCPDTSTSETGSFAAGIGSL